MNISRNSYAVFIGWGKCVSSTNSSQFHLFPAFTRSFFTIVTIYTRNRIELAPTKTSNTWQTFHVLHDWRKK